jgi:hypothetical protein
VAWREGIQRRFASTVAEQREKKRLFAELGRERHAAPRQDLKVLADVPHGDIDTTRLSDDQQRGLYESFQLEVRYNAIRNEAVIRVTVTSGIAQRLATTVVGAIPARSGSRPTS